LVSLGVRTAVSAFDPVVAGVQEQVAASDVVETEPQPVIVLPANLKLTLPFTEVEAVIVTALL
jgi:hypothetical protein